MADKHPEALYIVGKIMRDGVLVVHPSDRRSELLTEEEARPYVRKGWMRICDDVDSK